MFVIIVLNFVSPCPGKGPAVRSSHPILCSSSPNRSHLPRETFQDRSNGPQGSKDLQSCQSSYFCISQKNGMPAFLGHSRILVCVLYHSDPPLCVLVQFCINSLLIAIPRSQSQPLLQLSVEWSRSIVAQKRSNIHSKTTDTNLLQGLVAALFERRPLWIPRARWSILLSAIFMEFHFARHAISSHSALCGLAHGSMRPASGFFTFIASISGYFLNRGHSRSRRPQS